MHPRILIRNKFVELLDGFTDCEDKVYKNRARPFINMTGWVAQLPAMVVYTDNETSVLYNVAPQCYQRKVTVSVEIHANADEDTDDLLDHIAEQVEVLISRFTWESIDMEFNLAGTQMAVRDLGGERIAGACAIAFEITYYSNLPDDAKADSLDDFLTAHNTYKVGDAENKQTVVLRNG